MNKDSLRAATRAVHAGNPEPRPGAPVVAPIVQSATFHWSGPKDGGDLLYSRYGNNPSQLSAGARIASLEGMEAGAVFASGMGAIAMSILAFAEAGDRIVASRLLYGATATLLEKELPRRGVRTTFVDPLDPGSWPSGLENRTRAVLIELPTNPALRVFDVTPFRALAERSGAPLMADLTFATPINFRGGEHGIDLQLHSATKYLGGHSDLIAGAVAGRRKHVRRIVKVAKLYGPSLSPHSAWLLERGIRTLGPRMERHNKNAMELARWFEETPGARRVLYPGLESHPDHAAARRLLDGFGGMLSVVFADGGYADRFSRAVRIAASAPSLGGVETLISQPRYTSHADLSPEERDAMGIPDGFVRISVGLEDPKDLRRDFAQAMKKAEASSD